MFEALLFGRLVIAGGVIVDGAVVVAIGGAKRTGKIFDAVHQIGCGIAQPFGGAAVAEAARGSELDLHQADRAAAPEQRRPVFALAHDYAMHQRFRHQIGLGMGGNQRLILGALGEGGLRKWKGHGGQPCQRKQTSHLNRP
jgi:hypothetical protein